MIKFISGLVAGLMLGMIISAHAAQIKGHHGHLLDWGVWKGGELMCFGPYVWPTIKRIECR